MTENKVGGKTITTFKARIKATKPHYLGKVISYKETVEDAFNARYKSYMTVFMPRLTNKNKKPCVMCHVSNGSGMTLFRQENPRELSKLLRKLADVVDSDIWFDLFQELTSISEHLIDSGEVLLDEKFIDIKDFKNAIGMKNHETFPFIEIEP